MSLKKFGQIDQTISKLRSDWERREASLIRTVDRLEARVAKLEDDADPDAAVAKGAKPARIPPRPPLMKELGIGADPR